MSALNRTALATLEAAGITPEEWIRANYYAAGHWGGDVCGCSDDRCANGFHHHGVDDCGCLPVLIDEYRAGRL